MNKYTDKMLIQKNIKKGERVIPLNNRGIPVAVAMEDFDCNDIGMLNLDITYPINHNREILLLPGLKKIKNDKIIKTLKKSIKRKKNVRKRKTKPKNKRINK